MNQEIPSITIGNQKWKGADPIFNNNEIIIKILNKLLFKNIIIIIEANKNNEDPNVWIRKYFIIASDDINLFSLIKGIKDNKLISNPIHILIQELDEIDNNDLKINIQKKINFVIFLIKKKRI